MTRGSVPPHRALDNRVQIGKDGLFAKYSPEQPRVPAGNPDGGRWTGDSAGSADNAVDQVDNGDRPIEKPFQVAGLKCDGFSGGCQSDGSYGTSAMYKIKDRNLCWDCAVKILGLQDASSSEKVLRLNPYVIGK